MLQNKSCQVMLGRLHPDSVTACLPRPTEAFGQWAGTERVSLEMVRGTTWGYHHIINNRTNNLFAAALTNAVNSGVGQQFYILQS